MALRVSSALTASAARAVVVTTTVVGAAMVVGVVAAAIAVGPLVAGAVDAGATALSGGLTAPAAEVVLSLELSLTAAATPMSSASAAPPQATTRRPTLRSEAP